MSKDKYTPKDDNEKLMWEFMKANPEFTHKMIDLSLEVSAYHRTNFVAKLKRLGVIQRCGARDLEHLFTIHTDDERRDQSQQRRKTPEGVMWSSLRILRTFSAIEVYRALEAGRPDVTLKHVNIYCQKLAKAEYLRVIVKAIPGKRNARYQLLNDTGPLAPEVKRKEVIIDRNNGKVAHVEGAQL